MVYFLDPRFWFSLILTCYALPYVLLLRSWFGGKTLGFLIASVFMILPIMVLMPFVYQIISGEQQILDEHRQIIHSLTPYWMFEMGPSALPIAVIGVASFVASLIYLPINVERNDPAFGGRFILAPGKYEEPWALLAVQWAIALGLAYNINFPQPWMAALGALEAFPAFVQNTSITSAGAFIALTALTKLNAGAIPGFSATEREAPAAGRARWSAFRFVSKLKVSGAKAQGLSAVFSRRSAALRAIAGDDG